MGWMHDSLHYIQHDPIHRCHHHGELTFGLLYAFSERFVLPISHDEVVHGKRALIDKMPGDRWQQFANLRLLLGYQWTSPGKKLLFMGAEIGAPDEWSHEVELPWPLLGQAEHAGVQGWVRRLNELYRETPALHRVDRDPAGFSWVIGDDRQQSVLAYLRYAPDEAPVLVVLNNTPVPRPGYRVGVPAAGDWRLLANSDDPGYGGSGKSPGEKVATGTAPEHGFDQSLELELPPLAIVILAPV
jgi:1,4-alpha-glucan branching enzyme